MAISSVDEDSHMPFKDPVEGKAYQAAYHQKNKVRIKTRQAAYYQTNKDQLDIKNRDWVLKHPEKVKGYRAKHKKKPQAKLVRNLRIRLRDALRGKSKSASTLELLGCSVDKLRSRLEAEFKPDPRTGEIMTWDNYGYRGWHVDHIRPCKDFDLNDPKQQQQCFHYTNLQPLWWWQNFKKGTKSNV